jgi:hypothetical protein
MRRILTALFVFVAFAGSAAAESIEGTWDFTYQTPDGARRATCDIELDGDKLTILQPGLGKLTGIYQDQKFAVVLENYYSPELGFSADIKLEGKLSEGKLSGKWEFETYSGTFSAQPADEQDQ